MVSRTFVYEKLYLPLVYLEIFGPPWVNMLPVYVRSGRKENFCFASPNPRELIQKRDTKIGNL